VPTPSRHSGKFSQEDRVNPDQEEPSVKNRLIIALAIVALVFVLSFPLVAPAAPPAPKPQPAPAATPAPEGHPEIHAAIDSLRHAREHLDHAAHDYHGHRTEAIGAIDNAIHQLQICLQYD
jgi:hypothetical protein